MTAGQSPANGGRNVGRAREILLVDDNLGDVGLIAAALEKTGIEHQLSVARNGEEALELLRGGGQRSVGSRPDLILLDLNLPRKGGRELLSELKCDAALQRIPVIVLTTSSAEQDVVLSYGAHANCYVVKPMGFPDLCEVMRSIGEFWLRIATLPPTPSARAPEPRG